MPDPIDESPPVRVRRPGWFPNPIDWSPIDRGLFLTAMAIGTASSNVAFLGWLSLPGSGTSLNPEFYGTTMWVALGLCFGSISLFVRGLVKRGRTRDWPFLSESLAHGYSLGVIFFSYATGLYTTQIATLLVTGVALGLPLLHRGAIARSVILGIIVLTVVLTLDHLNRIPYAPIFTDPPVDATGRPAGALRYWQMTLLVLAPAIVWLVVNALLVRWREREALLRDLAITDSLTGLYNRRRFFEYFESECLRSQRSSRPVSLIICDLDHFKNVNDQYGHNVGDLALRHVAAILRSEVRQGIDRVGRFGGEELVILLPETDLEPASAIAERMRAHLENTSLATGNGELTVTASFGVACAIGESAQADTLLEEADNMLYRAKQRGRNRVVASGPADQPLARVQQIS